MSLRAVAGLCARNAHLLPDEQLSYVCLRTNTPKYLILGASAEYPCAVAEFGQSDLKRTFDNATALHEVLPTLVPKPIVAEPAGADDWWTITSGAPGYPWFALHSLVRNADDWLKLFDRCHKVLSTFQAAVQQVDTWCGEVSPGDEIASQYRVCRERGIIRSDEHDKVIDEMVEVWTEHETITGYAQHGDFCLNNLVIDKHSTMLIDYEHFDRTRMPLQDELLLVHSLLRRKPADVALEFQEALARLTATGRYGDSFSWRQIQVLQTHQILWTLNDFYGIRGRAGRVEELFVQLEECWTTWSDSD
ncbi:MAG: hypothetical protein AAF417_21765 [Pseudomonadota bacterium]